MNRVDPLNRWYPAGLATISRTRYASGRRTQWHPPEKIRKPGEAKTIHVLLL
jgi:hypothetical protein